jgi:tetratricopeptide (TPR) repeat protein
LLGLLFGCATSSMNSTHSAASNNSGQPVDVSDVKPNAPLTANTHFAAGQVAESQNDLPRAIAQYEAACKLDRTATVPLLRLGMIYTQQGRFEQAIATWNRYIKATNGDASGYVDLGYTCEIAQRFSDAETAYKTAIARDPQNETAHVDYGLMLARQGKIDQAITQLQAVMSMADVHYNLASVLESKGKKEEAKAEYEKALQIDPAMTDAKNRLASLE